MPESPGRTITKKELVDRIAFELDQTKLVVRHVVQQFLNEISAELAAGNRIEFREFGVFEVRQRGRRRGQLPHLLEAAKENGDEDAPRQMERVVKFRPGRALRELGEPDSPSTQAAQRPAPTPPRPEAPAVRPPPPKPPPSTPGSPF